jgi:hypothetical protein
MKNYVENENATKNEARKERRKERKKSSPIISISIFCHLLLSSFRYSVFFLIPHKHIQNTHSYFEKREIKAFGKNRMGKK